MSKLMNVKEDPLTNKQKQRLQLMEYLNKHQENILSMTTQQIIIESASTIPKSTIYRIIKNYKQRLIEEGFKRICPELIDENI